MDPSWRHRDRAARYLESLPEDRVDLRELGRGKHLRYAAAFLGAESYLPVEADADVYLDFGVNYFGERARPLVVTLADLHTLLIPDSASLSWHGKKVWEHSLRLGLRHAEAVVCVSDATRRDVAEYFPDAAGKTVTVHNGIAAPWRDADAPVTGADVPDRPYWIWWGHVTARKNLPGLLRAYARLVDEAPSPAGPNGEVPELVLVATLGHDSEGLPDLVRALGLSERVHFLDPQPLDRLVALVDASRGLVFPSLHEGFGLPAVEALARGKKVLCSDRGALPEVTGGHAVLCDPEEVDDIVAGLRSLAGEQLSREEIHERRAWASQFTYERAARAYGEVIDRVVSGGSVREPPHLGTSLGDP